MAKASHRRGETGKSSVPEGRGTKPQTRSGGRRGSDAQSPMHMLLSEHGRKKSVEEEPEVGGRGLRVFDAAIIHQATMAQPSLSIL